jgi:hypothetical protein
MNNRKYMPVSFRLYYSDPFDDVIIENINKLDRKNGTITKFLRRHLYDSIRGVLSAAPPTPVIPLMKIPNYLNHGKDLLAKKVGESMKNWKGAGDAIKC